MKTIFFYSLLLSAAIAYSRQPAPTLPTLKNGFIVISHRGNHVQVPENTLAAVEEAIRVGSDYVEIDLRTTKDGYLVICHDASVNRTTNGKGNIKDLTLAEIRKLKIPGHDSASSNRSYRIPEFQEILKVCKNKINIYLDFKEADVAKTYRQLQQAGMEKQVIVYLNKESQYPEWRKIAPAVPLMSSVPETIKTAAALQAFFEKVKLNVVDNLYDPALVVAASASGVSVWLDVEAPQEGATIWNKAMSSGIHGMQTDHPEELINYLKQNKLRDGFRASASSQPKIIVGMMVDQMRWDYLYRFTARYGEGGFKRLLREGFSCENTMIDYAPTVTACGHTCVYTGSVPAIHGIAGNDWFDRSTGKTIGCVDDSTVSLVGTPGKTGQSPHNNLATTITDQLRIATNYQSKTVGVAIKDRASILPAGHAATAAFWFSASDGKFITSSYYMKELPEWAKKFNERKVVDQYYEKDWETIYPVESYKSSTADDMAYENTTNGDAKPVFPHPLKQFIGKNYGAVRTTPYGNTLTFDFAKAAIEGYDLGGGAVTDFLAVSFSSPDAIGHTYGPNSIEQEDDYLRLDQELAEFFSWLDQRFGKGNYLYFITADHGVAESPGYLLDNKLPSGAVTDSVYSNLEKVLAQKFAVANPVLSFNNDQIYMNWDELDKKAIDHKSVELLIKKTLLQSPGIADVVPTATVGSATLPEPIKSMLIKGYNVKRGGDFYIISQPSWKDGSIKGATHGTWNPYDAHIPLVWMGWKIEAGHTNRLIGMTDIAPTLAALLQIQMPSGCIGQPIQELTGTKESR